MSEISLQRLQEYCKKYCKKYCKTHRRYHSRLMLFERKRGRQGKERKKEAMKFRCARKQTRRREDRSILDGITDLRCEEGILDTLSWPQWTNDKKRETWGILFLAPGI